MRRIRTASHLGIIFVVAIVIPSVVLALMAIRAIQREEAYIEKRLEGTLLTEVNHVVSLINGQLTTMHRELMAEAPEMEPNDATQTLPSWQRSSPWVQTSFLLSPTYQLVYPTSSGGLTSEQQQFLDDSERFFTGKQPVPVYQNIVAAYTEEILAEAPETSVALRTQEPMSLAYGVTERSNALAEQQKESPKPAPTKASKARAELDSAAPEAERSTSNLDEYAMRQAMAQFDEDALARRRVYERAAADGQQVLKRNVRPSRQQVESAPDAERPESILISQERTFGEIAQASESGIIPRFVRNQLQLIFWKRLPNLHIIGCVVAQNALMNQMLSVLPSVSTAARILTVLDADGQPLITPPERGPNWQQPFVASEISEWLPHWEIAAYLTDPEIIASKAQSIATIMWVLVSILLVSIVSGSILVVRVVNSEVTLARQKTTFVANVSHELKTPLTSIRMFAEMLRGNYQPDRERQEEYLDIMVSETERLTRLINNILNFSKMEQGEKQYDMRRVDVMSLGRELLENQRVGLEHKGFEVQLEGDGALLVQADGEAIKQVLLNILSNAAKYSGDIKHIEMEVLQKDRDAVINIKDRGVGISPAAAKHIFEKFYRADDTLTSKVRGTGLGLTIAQKITEDHGGSVRYFPRTGGGSIFQVRLPLEE